MKASRSEAPPPSVEGLRTCGLMPAFRRYSQPRWACTLPIRCSPLSKVSPSARSTSPAERRPFQESHPQLRLPLLVKQRLPPSSGIGVVTVAEPLDSLRLVAAGDLSPTSPNSPPSGHLPDRVPKRHPPDHRQVGTPPRIGGLAVEALQSRGLRFLRVSLLTRARSIQVGSGITGVVITVFVARLASKIRKSICTVNRMQESCRNLYNSCYSCVVGTATGGCA